MRTWRQFLESKESDLLTDPYQTLKPTPDKTYKSDEEVIEDWDAGEDFVLVNQGLRINKDQVGDGVVVNVRYDNDRKVCPIKNNAHGKSTQPMPESVNEGRNFKSMSLDELIRLAKDVLPPGTFMLTPKTKEPLINAIRKAEEGKKR